jgi:hypothetical protein
MEKHVVCTGMMNYRYRSLHVESEGKNSLKNLQVDMMITIKRKYENGMQGRGIGYMWLSIYIYTSGWLK